jgi:hypothetical protein
MSLTGGRGKTGPAAESCSSATKTSKGSRLFSIMCASATDTKTVVRPGSAFGLAVYFPSMKRSVCVAYNEVGGVWFANKMEGVHLFKPDAAPATLAGIETCPAGWVSKE